MQESVVRFTLFSLKQFRFKIQFGICMGILIYIDTIHKLSALLLTETSTGYVVTYTCFAMAICFCPFGDDICRYRPNLLKMKRVWEIL